MLIKIPRAWEISESLATPESVYLDRRKFVKQMGLGTAGLSALLSGCHLSVDEPPGYSANANVITPEADLYPAGHNDRYQVPERGITPEELATTYNNFYEFTTVKSQVWELVDAFETNPWSVEVTGLVNQPQVIDFDELIRQMPLEERIYRFRCVEAWSMTVPWTGFPFSALVDLVEPLSSATHVRFVTAFRPEQMPGIDVNAHYPWPYYEGLRMDEALNELTLMVTGAYGAPLPRQNGAPLRLIVPWKYGYKSIKSIVKIEFVDEEPPTFWNTLAPSEYGFLSNVDPDVDHPRWSQENERLLDTQELIPTLKYNGYEEFVGHMYA